MPKPIAVVRAKISKRLVQIVTVGLPLFSMSTAAWIHHVEQAPQSPTAIITISAEAAICFTSGAFSAAI